MIGGIVALVAMLLFVIVPTTETPLGITGRLWSIVNSAIFIATVSTFIAAFAGTWGAQLLAERTIKRNERLLEIRGTNVAIGLAFNIANTYITAKKQLINGLVEQFELQQSSRQAHQASVALGMIPSSVPFVFQVELRTISTPFSPIEELQKVLRDKISPDGKALILLTPLIQSMRGFADTAAQRNAWIEDFKRLPNGNDAHGAHLYFGTPFAPGRVDERYPNYIKSLKEQTDDCIAFSILIAECLKRYGDKLAKQYGEGAPKISAPQFGDAGDLLPDMGHYARWTQA